MKRGQRQHVEYVRRTWDDVIAPLRLEEERLRFTLEQRQQTMNEISQRSAGWNPVRGAREAYRRAQHLPRLARLQEETVKERNEVAQKILTEARNIADKICADEAKRNPALKRKIVAMKDDCGQIIRDMRSVAPLLSRVEHMMQRADETLTECKRAKNMGDYYVVGGGVAISMMADRCQKKAEEALNLFAHELKNYAASLTVQGEAKERKLGLTLECFGNSQIFDARLKNYKMIEQAVSELERVQAEISVIWEQFAARYDGQTRKFEAADLQLRNMQADMLDRTLPGAEFAKLRELVRQPSILVRKEPAPRP